MHFSYASNELNAGNDLLNCLVPPVKSASLEIFVCLSGWMSMGSLLDTWTLSHDFVTK